MEKSQLQLAFRQLALTNKTPISPLKKNEFLFVPKKTPLQGHSREGQNFPRPALDTELNSCIWMQSIIGVWIFWLLATVTWKMGESTCFKWKSTSVVDRFLVLLAWLLCFVLFLCSSALSEQHLFWHLGAFSSCSSQHRDTRHYMT